VTDARELADIGKAVRARHVATPMSELLTVAPNDSAAESAERLRARQFDFAPAVEESRVQGIFSVADATDGTVADRMAPVQHDDLVAADTPFTALVEHMAHREFVLVLNEHEITGMVTRSDLGSAPARTHYYLRLASAEMHLARYVRVRYPDQSAAVRCLSAARRDAHRVLVESLSASNTYIDDVAALSFADLVDIAGMDDQFRDLAQGASGRGWRWQVDGLVNFRNNLMHPARDVTSLPDFTVAKLVEAEKRISALSLAADEVLRLIDRRGNE